MHPDKPGPLSTPARSTASGGGVQEHLRLGWWSLLFFLSLGIVLEGLHGLKIGYYLDVPNQTRRFMWTLAHAHGTLLALVHLGFAATVALVPLAETPRRTLISRLLTGAGVLIPAGFFGGGLFPHAGDPGVCILLVPVGAAMLFTAVFLTARMAGGRIGPQKTPGAPQTRKK